MTPPNKSQLNLPPALLTNSSEGESPRTNCSQDPEVVLSAQLFDEALREAKLTSQEVAHLLRVSESLVNRMRSPNYREGVSLTQMLRLPLAFHLELHRAMNRRFGFGRQLIRRLLDAVSDLAVAIEP